METNPYIESRFKKMLIPCPVCQKPMAERHGNRVWFLKGVGSQIRKVEVNMVFYSNGHYKINCSSFGCRGGSTFGVIHEAVGIQDTVKSALRPV